LPLKGYIPDIIKLLIFLQEIGHDIGGQDESTADSGAEKSMIHPENMVSPVREKDEILYVIMHILFTSSHSFILYPSEIHFRSPLTQTRNVQMPMSRTLWLSFCIIH
jgi:hypothetical protein